MLQLNWTVNELVDEILKISQSDFEQQKELCLLLHSKSKEESNLYGQAFANIYLGSYYVSQNASEQCAPLLLEGIHICEEHDFLELKLKACSLLGIYFDMVADEYSAMQHNMEALRLSRVLNNRYIECKTLVQIANTFLKYCDFQEARRFGLRAFETMDQYPKKDQAAQLLLVSISAGLVESYLIKNEIEIAREYCAYADNLDLTLPIKEISAYRNWCYYYAITRDDKKSLAYATKILKLQSSLMENKLVGFDICRICCESMLAIKHEEYASQFLHLMQVTGNEEGMGYQVQEMKMNVSLTFLPESEHEKAYKEYYEKHLEVQCMSNRVRVGGMKSKIHLYELMKEKDIIKERTSSLEEEIHKDELTKLYNRRYFNQISSYYIASPQIITMGYVMIDVDCFKEYNDFYGHIQGDYILKVIGECLLKYSTNEIIPSRFGGDEFLCVCVDQKDEDIECFITNVRNELRSLNLLHKVSTCSNQVTLSIGYANERKTRGIQVYELMELADRALYQSKLKGRNTYTKQIKET